MSATADRYNALLEAARNLLSARADQMITVAEWEALQKAVDACAETTQRSEPR